MVPNELKTHAEKLIEANQYYFKALLIFEELQSNNKILARSSAPLANIDLALHYISCSLESFPENPIYLNLIALLLLEGKADKKLAYQFLKKASLIDPCNTVIQNNFKAVKSNYDVIKDFIKNIFILLCHLHRFGLTDRSNGITYAFLNAVYIIGMFVLLSFFIVASR